MDRINKLHRSWNMSRIRNKNTKPEIIVRSALHKLGFRFRLHIKSLPGKPDIVLAKYKIAIFVHGCFWHRHEGCKYAYTPKSHTEFWQSKFESNIKRDQIVMKNLRELGWNPIIIWECQTENPDQLNNFINNLAIVYSSYGKKS